MILFADSFHSFGKLPIISSSMSPAPPPHLLSCWYPDCTLALPEITDALSVHFKLFFPCVSFWRNFSYHVFKFTQVFFCNIEAWQLPLSSQEIWLRYFLLDISQTSVEIAEHREHHFGDFTSKVEFPAMITDDWPPSPYEEGHRHVSDSVHTW